MADNKKSSILDLVDLYIGNILRGNLYTDLNSYLNFVKTPQTPSPLPPHANASDTRPLNIPGPNAHPHNGLVRS